MSENTQHLPAFVDKGVKWKSGPIEDLLPFSEDFSSYEDLKKSSVFRDYFLNHPNDCYIISKLLDESGDVNPLHVGIEAVRKYSAEEIAQTSQHFAHLHSCHTVGANVKLEESIEIVDRMLKSQSAGHEVPFLDLNQRRLTLYSSLVEAVEHSRKTHSKSKRSRKWKQDTLTSVSHPEVSVIHALQGFGLSMLKFVPLYLKTLGDHQKVLNNDIMLPVLSLCDQLHQLEELELFSTWAPRQRQPLRSLDLSAAIVASSEDSHKPTPSNINSLQWHNNQGGWCSLILPQAQHVQWVRVSWISTDDIAAPDSIAIFTKASASDTESYHKIGTFVIEEEANKQGSWHQMYYIGMDGVQEIKLVFSRKLCSMNGTIAYIQMHEVSLYSDAHKSTWLNNLSTYHEVQQSLLPLLEFDAFSKKVLLSMIRFLRSCASLSLLLTFVEHLLNHPLYLREVDEELSLEMLQFLESIGREYNRVKTSYEQRVETKVVDVENVQFDDKKRSGDFEIIQEGKAIRTGDNSRCIVLNSPLCEGVTRWTLSCSNPASISLGVIMNNAKFDSALEVKKAWLLRLRDKNLQAKGEDVGHLLSPGVVPDNECVHFEYDSTRFQLSVSLEGKQQYEVMFDNISVGCLPIVVVEHRNDAESVTVELKELQTIRLSSTPNAAPLQLLDMPILRSHSLLQFAEHIIAALANLCQLHMQLYERNLQHRDCLEEAFSVEVNSHVIQKLTDLISNRALPEPFIPQLLTVLELQLLSLKRSQLTLAEVEYPFEFRDKAANNVSIHQTKKLLQDLTKFGTESVKVAAANVFSKGVEVFFPLVIDRIKLVIEMLATWQSALYLDKSSVDIVFYAVESISRLDRITETISLSQQAEHTSIIRDYVAMLLLFVRQLEIREFQKASGYSSLIATVTQYLQGLVFEVIRSLQQVSVDVLAAFMSHFLSKLCTEGVQFLREAWDLRTASTVSDAALEKLFQRCFMTKLVPLAFSTIVQTGFPLQHIVDVVPCMSDYVAALSRTSAKMQIHHDSMLLLASSFRSMNGIKGASGARGWKTVKASFEDGDPTFNISDNGTTYTSVSSSNTCSIVNQKFSRGQKGAWEFLLETDSLNDECSVFGAAKLPLSSRCYTSSPDLWMRRAYNGYLYSLGQTRGNSLEKIHPGDIVRMEYDGTVGTLSFSINGAAPEIGFTEITDDIYPACGSYRNGVVVKLLKVEIYDQVEDADEDVVLGEYYPSPNLSWATSVPSKQSRSTLRHPLSADKDSVGKTDYTKWFSSRINKGVSCGKHSWSFELSSACRSPFSFGLVGERVIQEQTRISSIPKDSMVWNSDGSLWVNGEKRAVGYGKTWWPFKSAIVLKVVVDRSQKTVEFFVNGQSGGLAFGPPGSGASCEVSMTEKGLLFPAVSIAHPSSKVKAMASGMLGSTELPALMSLAVTGTSVVSRLAAMLVQGSAVQKQESSLVSWFQSPIFVGGLDLRFLQQLNQEKTLLRPMEEMKLMFRDCFQAVAEDSISFTDQIISSLVSFTNESLLADNSEIRILYDWFETIDPEPLALRKALEKNNSFRFPACELPLMACMLKHSDMGHELTHLFENIKQQGSSFNMEPSENMNLIIQKVKQLRTYLRKQRQAIKAKDTTKMSEVTSEDDVQDMWETAMSSLACLEDPSTYFQAQSIDVADSTNLYQLTFGKCSLSATGCTLFVLLDVKGWNGSVERLELKVGETVVTASESKVLSSKVEGESLGIKLAAWFDLSMQPMKCSDFVTFALVLGDKSTAEFKLEAKLQGAMEVAENSWEQKFEKLCQDLASRAMFLCCMKAIGPLNNLSEKTTLIGLTSFYSANDFSNRTVSDTSRVRTQERWKRVIEFLHTQSKMRRQRSRSEELPEMLPAAVPIDLSPTDDHKYEVSNAQAVIQACSVFVSSPDIDCNLHSLLQLVKVRMARAGHRSLGLNLFHNLLEQTETVENPFVLGEIMTLAKCCIPPVVAMQNSKKPMKLTSSHHYLCHLEGCSSSLLEQVQFSVMSLYQRIVQVLRIYLQHWEAGIAQTPVATCTPALGPLTLSSVHERLNSKLFSHAIYVGMIAMLKLINMQFSSRDHSWLLDTDVISLLHKFSSFTFKEDVWNKLEASKRAMMQFVKRKQMSRNLLKDLPSTALWSWKQLHASLRDGSVSIKRLLAHLVEVAVTTNSKSEGEDNQSLLDSITAAYFDDGTTLQRATELFAKLSHEVAVIINTDTTSSSAGTTKEACGICALDPSKKASRISLSDSNFTASLPEDASGSSICVFGTRAYSAANAEELGNYFEATIVSVGHGDIGIGFADRNTFHFVGNMPGWTVHSYGYHGDDGKKYGVNGTPGEWPIFETGDVIGCGWDFDRKVLYFTRNGVLLGDGFIDIAEEELWPIVGFSNRHQDFVQVRMNFGTENFLFEEPQVMVGKLAVDARLKRSAQVAVSEKESMDSNCWQVLREYIQQSDGNTESETDMSCPADISDSMWLQYFKYLLDDCRNAEALRTQHRTLECIGLNLMSAFALLTMRAESEQLGHIPMLAHADNDKFLMRGISAFGSSSETTNLSVISLQKTILVCVVQELIIATEYLLQSDSALVSLHDVEEQQLGLLTLTTSKSSLDKAQVQCKLTSILTSIQLIVDTSELLRSEFSASSGFVSLLQLLDVGTFVNISLAISLLKKLLPHMDPESIENRIPAAWKRLVEEHELTLVDHSTGRKTRKLPDTIVRKLLLLAATAYVETSHVHDDFNGLFLGEGDVIIKKSKLALSLLQSLFEEPLWEEIVAFNVTSSLRHAELALSASANSSSTASATTTSHKFAVTTAAVKMLSLETELDVGSRVELSNGSLGIVVATETSDGLVAVALDINSKDFSCLKQIELVETKNVELKNRTVRIDFAKLSQPIVPQMVSLMKLLLEADSAVISTLQLSGAILFSIDKLLQQQEEVVAEALLDLGAVELFVGTAVQTKPSPFPSLITLSKTKQLVRFVEARKLEDSSADATDAVVDDEAVVLQSNEATEMVDSGEVGICTISLERRSSHLAIAKRLEEQSGVPESRCLELLEYNMLDEAKTLEMLATEGEYKADEEDKKADTEITGLKMEISDESMLRGIEYVDSKGASVLDSNCMQGLKWKLKKVETACEKWLVVTEKDVEGVHHGDVGTLLRLSEPLDEKREYSMVLEYDRFRQLQFARPLLTAAVREVRSLEDVNLAVLKHKHAAIQSLLNTMFIRNILLKLLLQGMINSSHLGNTSGEQLKLLKLSIASSSSDYSKALLALSNVLMPPTSQELASSTSKDVAEVLVDDAVQSLESICSLRSMFQSQQQASDGIVRKLSFGSAHPFYTPLKSCGKITVPKDWNGMNIQFDSRCRTPSGQAKLEFYTSLDKYSRQQADHCFWGMKGDKQYFANLQLNATFDLYYRFSAPMSSHLPPLDIKLQHGDMKCNAETGVWSSESTRKAGERVGLGEDDSLFNLFETEPVVGASEAEEEDLAVKFSTIVVDCVPIQSGTFAFQILIKESPPEEHAHNYVSVGWQKADIVGTEKYIVGQEASSVGVTSDGKVFQCGELVDSVTTVTPWKANDLVSFIFGLEGEELRFVWGKDEEWSPVQRCVWKDAIGVKPAISVGGHWKVQLLTESACIPSSVRTLFGDIAFLASQQDKDKLDEVAWGYQFTVEPLKRLNFHVTRDFELVWSAKEDEVCKGELKALWVWRPKACGDFLPAADIVTTDPHPPRRSLLVHKSQCKKPMKFVCVFNSSKQNVVVWRAITEDGYVSMGDVVTQGSSVGSPPSTSNFLCLPTWAVQDSEVCNRYSTIKKVGEGKLCYNASLWGSSSVFGYFFGSPYDSATSDLPLHSEFKCHGVAKGYRFSSEIEANVLAEWLHEEQVISTPSLSFSLGVLEHFMNSAKWNSLMLKDSLFTKLITYMKTNTAADPFRVIPILIQMVRRAFAERHALPYQDVKNLCRVILTEAVAMVQTSKKTEIPKSLMALVDFVVEIQAAHVIESGHKDRHAISRIIKKEKFRLEWQADEESKEEVDVIESKEDDSDVLKPSVMQLPEKQWWERPSISSNELKFHRVIRRESMENIFAKEPILLKLKQVLKFLYAINTPESELSTSSLDQHALERSFPKLMTSKLWFDLISSCSLIESQHPYREKTFYRKVCFPGVQYVSISLDRRCALSPGDKLILRTEGKTVEIVGGGTGNETLIKKGAQFIANTIEIILERNAASEMINVDHEWGWAVLVSASGPIYEQAELSIDLQDAISSAAENFSTIEEDLAKLSISAMQDFVTPMKLKAESVLSSPVVDDSKPHHEEHDSILEDVLESPDLESPSSGIIEEVNVGMSSADIVSFLDGALPRPKTKRGKRGEEDSKAIEAAKSPSPPSLGVTEKKPVDPEIEAIMKLGVVVRNGSMRVPYASELEIRVERVTPKDEDKDFLATSFVIDLRGSKPTAEGDHHKQYKVSPNWYTKVILTGSQVEYTLYALKTARLQQILDAQQPTKPVATDSVDSGTGQSAELDPLITARSVDSTPPVEVVEDVKTPEVENDMMAMSSNWACEMCTYINEADDALCAMCGTSRPGETAAAAEPVEALWFCPACTLLNPLNATRCSACGSAQPGAAVSSEETSPEEEGDTSEPEEEKEEEDSRPVTPVPGDKDRSSAPSSPVKASTASNNDLLKISCKGKLDNFARFESRLEAAMLSKGTILTPLQVHHRVSKWTKDCDFALIDYLNSLKSNKADLNAFPLSFVISKQFLTYEGLVLAKLSMLDIIIRAQLIESFNRQLESLLPLIDLSNDDPASLGAMIRKSNRYLLMKVKNPLLEKAIASTSAKGTEPDVPANITLDNYKALHSRESGDKEPSTSQNCFVQCFRQLQKKDAVIYRHIFSTDRVFQISFLNESGIDAGGVYREGLSRVLEDLFSENFSLLVLCPNGQQAVHSGMDKFLPNPKHIGPLAMEMFEFIGKLMSMSIRSKACLPFEFPPLVWKKIVGEDVGDGDLLEIDKITSRQLDDIENCHRDPVEPILDQASFDKKYAGKLKFTYVGLDNVEHELLDNGRLQEVTFENRFEYCSLVRRVRLNECNVQVAAMAKGMGEVIPMRALLLFSAAQLEELVCGSPKIDMDLWKAQTEASGLSANTVKLFWKVMESLSPKDQTGFIRFAWGRSRLPSRKEDFTVKMKLTSGGRAALPASHTCFFSIELPEYRTEEEMRHGLLTAIHYGVGGILNG